MLYLCWFIDGGDSMWGAALVGVVGFRAKSKWSSSLRASGWLGSNDVVWIIVSLCTKDHNSIARI